MYEGMYYEWILQRMIDRVLEKNPNMNVIEGSMSYNTNAPAAYEFQNVYIELDVILNETYADTASRYYLKKRAKERNVFPYPATHAILQGEFNQDIPIGSRFSLEDLNYKAIEKISTGVYKMQCETAGAIANDRYGMLEPIDYIQGLTSSELTKILIPGEDEEETEHLRQRYFDSLEGEAFGGNQKDYKVKVGAIAGVGGVKVYPVWNGGGTVKLVITASDHSIPSQTLIDDVQTKVDPIPNQGAGLGIAPIGHVVTVEGVTPFVVHVQTHVTLLDGYVWDDIKRAAEREIDDYFRELISTWDSSSAIIVRIIQIEIRLLNFLGVVDVENTMLNGVAQNLTLGENSIPIRGEVSG